MSPLKGILERDKFSIKTHTRKRKDKCGVISPEAPIGAPTLPSLRAELLGPSPSHHSGHIRAGLWPAREQPQHLHSCAGEPAPHLAQVETAPGPHGATQPTATDVTPTRILRDACANKATDTYK